MSVGLIAGERSTEIKFVRLNMNKGDIAVEEVPQDYIGLGVGGLTSALGRLGITALIVEETAPEGELYVLKIDCPTFSTGNPFPLTTRPLK